MQPPPQFPLCFSGHELSKHETKYMSSRAQFARGTRGDGKKNRRLSKSIRNVHCCSPLFQKKDFKMSMSSVSIHVLSVVSAFIYCSCVLNSLIIRFIQIEILVLIKYIALLCQFACVVSTVICYLLFPKFHCHLLFPKFKSRNPNQFNRHRRIVIATIRHLASIRLLQSTKFSKRSSILKLVEKSTKSILQNPETSNINNYKCCKLLQSYCCIQQVVQS